jgi:hypothetical protein
MQHQSLKDQLKTVVQQGVLKPVITQPNKPTTWAGKQIVKVARAGRATVVLNTTSDHDDPNFVDRINDVRVTIKGVHAVCSQYSKGKPLVLKARRAAETALNFISTFENGFVNRDIPMANLVKTTGTLCKYLRELRVALQEIDKEAEPRASIEEVTKEAIEHFKLAEDRFNQDISRNVGQSAILIDAPVIPVYDQNMGLRQKLQEAGLPVEELGGYPVLLKQRLLCLDTGKLEDRGMDKKEFIQQLLDKLNSGSGANWQMVSDDALANARHGRLLYWLMPSKNLEALVSATGGNLMRSWGTAF